VKTFEQVMQAIMDEYKETPTNEQLAVMRRIYDAGAASNVKRRPLIGIAGKAGVGKDTAADALVPLGYGKRAFAGPLKTMLIAAGILTKAETEDRDLKEKTLDWCDRSPRQMMQTLGTEWARNCNGDDFWLKLAARDLQQSTGGIVYTDVRFENEAEFIRRNGGLVVHIDREGLKRVTKHESESGLSYRKGVDEFIVNNCTKQTLWANVQLIARQWYPL
jgi:hypothetical protein